MNAVANLDEIPELCKSNVHVNDKKDLLKKINLLIAGGHKKLQIVTDFDHTLTRHNLDNGDVVQTSFGIFFSIYHIKYVLILLYVCINILLFISSNKSLNSYIFIRKL